MRQDAGITGSDNARLQAADGWGSGSVSAESVEVDPAGSVAADNAGDLESTQLIPAAPAGEPSPVRETASRVLMVTGIALLVLMTYRLLRKSWRARSPVQRATLGTPRERIDDIHATAQRRDEAQESVSETAAVVRHFAAQLDAKSARLEVLLDRAEARISELEAAAHAATQAASRAQASGVSSPQAADGSSGPSSDSAKGQGRVSERRGWDTPDPMGGGESSPDALEREVLLLASQGMAAREIASKLGQPIGQVELVLALRRRSSA